MGLLNTADWINLGARPVNRIYSGATKIWNYQDALEAGVRRLFANNEPGAWYDPSDMSTLFQDSAGTTPVTAVGQPVGLMLDKRLGLVRGPELLPQPMDFGSSFWVTTATVSAPNGFQTLGAAGFRAVPAPLVIGKTYEVVAVNPSSSGPSFDLVNAGSGAVPVILRLNTGTRAIFTAASEHFYIRAAGSGTFTLNGLSVRELPGNHASQTTTTARPLLQQDGQGKRYLQFDGVDDYLSAASFDLSMTDKVHVFAGVVADAAVSTAIITEISNNPNTTNGTFSLQTSPTGSSRLVGLFRGTGLGSPFGAQTIAGGKYVVHTAGDIAGNLSKMDINGIPAASSPTNLGGGNFSRNALYVGMRWGTTLPFKGRLHPLLIVGGALTDKENDTLTRYVNSKTGAY